MSVVIDPQDVSSALSKFPGKFRIIRKGVQNGQIRVLPYSGLFSARAAWNKADYRQGWALLVGPEGEQIDKFTGPLGVRTKW